MNLGGTSGREREVRGRIEVVTRHPIVLRPETGARAWAARLLERRPWLVAAVLAGAALLLSGD